MKKLIFTTLTITIIFAACKNKQSITETKVKKQCSSGTPSYAVDIKPILEQHCVKCHGNKGGYDLTNFDDISRSVKNGDLIGTIKWQSGYPKMPARAPQLDSATIAKIECWIDNGAKQ